MRISKPFLYASVAGVLAGLMVVGANAQTAAALSGQVSSAEEGAMEGVLVSAKKDGSTITTTVVTNDKGQYSFPAGPARARALQHHHPRRRLQAGRPEAGRRRRRRRGDRRSQARQDARTCRGSSPTREWLVSAPGSDQIKSFLPDCVGCHTLQRVFSAMHSPEEWKQVFARMGRYAPESVPTRPQLLLAGRSAQRAAARSRQHDGRRREFPVGRQHQQSRQ